MKTTRLNISLPTSISNDIDYYSKQLNKKKSHIIASALDMYFDYIDLKEAERRLDDNEPTISMQEMRKELGL